MRVRWFGEPWPAADYRAPICDSDDFRVKTPVGQRCIYCPDEVEEGERGVLMASSGDLPESFLAEIREGGKIVWAQVCASHIDCLVRATAGESIAKFAAPSRRPGAGAGPATITENLVDRLRLAMGHAIPESRVCAVCERRTWHPMDIATGWCSACEDFTGDESRADLYALAANLRGPESAALFQRLDEHAGVASLSKKREEEFVVLGKCPHGFDLDREFCPEGCRV